MIKPDWWTLKNIIQDLIEKGTISIGDSQGKNNVDHTIFKTPLQDHDKGKASNSWNDNNANYVIIKHVITLLSLM